MPMGLLMMLAPLIPRNAIKVAGKWHVTFLFLHALRDAAAEEKKLRPHEELEQRD
jgi:hypothetical protein